MRGCCQPSATVLGLSKKLGREQSSTAVIQHSKHSNLQLVARICFLVTLFSSEAESAGVSAPSAVGIEQTGAAYVGEAFSHLNETWQVYSDPTGKLYFHNEDLQHTQWADPRLQPLPRQQTWAAAPEDRKLLWSIALLPFSIFAAAIAARVYYLLRKTPDLLFPKKERKRRRRQHNKEKAPKSRFKASQDGKGGRSANS